MINNIKIWAVIIVFSFINNGCKKDDFSFEEERNKIVGNWSLNEAIDIVRGDTLFNEIENQFVLELNEDGTGVEIGGINKSIEWQYQFNPEKISIIFSDNLTSIDHRIFDVVINNIDKQSWIFTEEISSKNRNITTWKLLRQ